MLDVSHLEIGYHRKPAQVIASDINFTLSRGSLVSLIGENGIGKSTLLRTIAGLQRPLSGSIKFDEKDLLTYKPSELATKLSLVLTEKLPPSNLTVWELIAIGRQPYNNWIGTLSSKDKVQIELAMERTQTAHLATKRHYEISDGQLQKVMIARALAQDTPFIILDEPTTHLDLVHKIALFQLLRKLAHETQKCILFSTHDIDLAIEMSDEMIVMSKDSLTHDSPKNLIINNVFNTLFDSDLLSFDPEKVKFVFKNPQN